MHAPTELHQMTTGRRREWLTGAALVSFPTVLPAAQAAAPMPMAGDRVLEVVVALAVVLGAIVALAWFARRVLQVRPGAEGRMRVLGGLSMGSRERVVLVQVGEEQLLLGVAPGRVQTLHVLARPIETSPPAAEGDSGGQFAAMLKRWQRDPASQRHD